MNRNRVIIAVVAVALLLLLALLMMGVHRNPPATIANNNDPNILGAWTGSMVDPGGKAYPGVSATFNFHRDGTIDVFRTAPNVRQVTVAGTFETAGDYVTVNYSAQGAAKPTNFAGSYSIVGDTLTIDGATHYVLTRQY